jgi:hypothetical protein
MTTTNQNQNDRVLVHIPLPAGKLGVSINDPEPQYATNNHVWVRDVTANSPLTGKLVPGDWIVRINEFGAHGRGVGFCEGILAATAVSTTRIMVVLRSRTSSPAQRSVDQQKENTVNTKTNTAVNTNNQAMPTVTPHQTFKKAPPPPPLSQVSAAHAPLTTTTTTTTATTTMTKKPPPFSPLKISLSINKAGEKPNASVAHAPLTTTTTMKKKPPPLQVSVLSKKAGSDKPKPKKKKQQLKPAPLHGFALPKTSDMPDPGFVCHNERFYCTHNNETVAIVAAKLGCSDWKALANLPQNKQRYGILKANARFQAHTLLAIPASRSQWKMKQLKAVKDEDLEECVDCGIASNPAELLLCDGCDSLHHVHCVGLSAVPAGDWFCRDCTTILQARAAHMATAHSVVTNKILAPVAPMQLPLELTLVGQNMFDLVNHRRTLELQGIKDIYATGQKSWQARKVQLQTNTTQLEARIVTAKRIHAAAQQQAMDEQGVDGWHLHLPQHQSAGWIELRGSGRLLQKDETKQELVVRVGYYTTRRTVESEKWKRAYRLVLAVSETCRVSEREWKNLKTELKTAQETLQQEEIDAKAFAETELRDRRATELRYAALLGEDKLDHETVTVFKQREPVPRYLGRIYAADHGDVLALNMLREPDELILTIPMDYTNADGIDIDSMEPKPEKWYGIFARQALFQKQRDDALPLAAGVRDAQRRLFRLLIEHNKDMLVSSPSLPPTVKVRTLPDTRCFDLGELVRDLDVDLDLPREPTPAVLAAKGLQLRDYQESSLRWMLDKEMENAGLGLAGELWHRLRFLDASGGDFFYCDLTGSWSLDIFDFRDDVDQKDASINRFSMPTGGVLGEEVR